MKPSWDAWTSCTCAVAEAHFEMVQWLRSQGCSWDDEEECAYAVVNKGQLGRSVTMGTKYLECVTAFLSKVL